MNSRADGTSAADAEPKYPSDCTVDEFMAEFFSGEPAEEAAAGFEVSDEEIRQEVLRQLDLIEGDDLDGRMPAVEGVSRLLPNLLSLLPPDDEAEE